MSKIFFFCVIIFLGLSSCGSLKTTSNPDNKEIVKSSNSYNKKTPSEKLVGRWEAEEIGDVLTQFEYSTPFILTFEKNNSFKWLVTQNGISIIREGTYNVINTDKAPYKIDLFQKAEKIGENPFQIKKINWHGIFKFQNKQLKFIVYKKSFIDVRPAVFSDTDTQTYRYMP